MNVRRRQRISIAVICALLAYEVLTGGGLVIRSWRYCEGQRDLRLFPGLPSRVSLMPEITEVSVPLVVHWSSSDRPFSVRVQIWDESKSFSSIDITDITVKYPDGQVTELADGWSWRLNPYTQVNSGPSGLLRTEMYMLNKTIPNVVLRRSDATITINGSLKNRNGAIVPFKYQEMFRCQSYWKLKTFWGKLAE